MSLKTEYPVVRSLTLGATRAFYHEQPRTQCECHECTQARWRMSIQGQIAQSLGGNRG